MDSRLIYMEEYMNNLLNKIKELLANDKVAKVKAFVMKYKNYIAVCGLFIVMVLILCFATGPDAIAKRLDRINNKTVSGEDYVPDKEFEINAYPELNNLIITYFDAYVNADFATLETLATPISNMEKSYITALSQFYEEYQNMKTSEIALEVKRRIEEAIAQHTEND